jgi:hypothetical protein
MIVPKGMREGLSPYDRLKGEEKAQELKGLVTPGGAAERAFKPRGREQHADLLGHAREAGFVGQPQEHKVSGSASLDIHVHGPAGTQAKMKKMEGLFKEARINRGWSMPRASENS